MKSLKRKLAKRHPELPNDLNTIFWKRKTDNVWWNYAGNHKVILQSSFWSRYIPHLIAMGTVALTGFALYLMNDWGKPIDRIPLSEVPRAVVGTWERYAQDNPEVVIDALANVMDGSTAA